METMTQPKLAGYRQLTEEEAKLINEEKELASQVEKFIGKLTTMPLTNGPVIDPRWLAIAKTDLQKGFMALTRAIAKPEGF